jgi:F1F0 ATPase subunit 2
MISELNATAIFLLALAFAAGSVLGVFYFTTLWQTVRRLPDEPRPLRLMLGSFVVRLAVVLPGFYLIMSGHWERLAAALLGFILIRIICVSRFGRVAVAKC